MKKHSQSSKEFLGNSKAYFINVTKESGRYTLHIKDTRRCPYSRFADDYIDFDSLTDAENSELNFKYCMRCFPDKKI